MKNSNTQNKNIEQLQSKLDKQYQILENKYTPIVVNLNKYSTPVNFKESLKIPIHRWYTYKEGFSPIFVNDFIARYSKSKKSIIFDPFGGIGTTVLEASILGHKAYSTDVNPLGNFASKIKSRYYSSNDILAIENALVQLKNIKSNNICNDMHNITVRSYFDEITYNSLLNVKRFISSLSLDKTQGIFKLALLSIIETISTHRKDGNGVKRKRNIPHPVTLDTLITILSDRVIFFINDVKSTKIKSEPTIIEQSCLSFYQLPEKVDIVITSPPYANCFDYSKVYLTELWIGDFFKSIEDQTVFRERSVVSHVHYKWEKRNGEYESSLVKELIVPLLIEKKLWSKSIPSMINGYFSDMGRFLDNLSKNLNTGASIGIVVGNSVYGGVIIPSDLIISDIATTIGYNVEKIEIYRKLSSSSQQMKIIKESDKSFLRESLIILKWNN